MHVDRQIITSPIITKAHKKYTVSQKTTVPNVCPYLCKILIDLRNSFTDTNCGSETETMLVNCAAEKYVD